jgi:hypothetical protein
VITADLYTAFTGAPAPAGFDALRDLVVARIEDAINRRLVAAERTERLTAYADGWVYPTAFPVTVCDDALEIDTDRIRIGQAGSHDVTYTAGYDTYGDPNGAPVSLALAVAWAIHTIRNPQPVELAEGITAMSVAGEFSVSREAGVRYGADGEVLPGEWARPIADLGGRCASLVAGFRRVR